MDSIIKNAGGLAPPPHELFKPLIVPQGRLLMGPGPANLYSRVQRALGNPVIGHMHPEMFQIMDEIKAGMKYLFQTSNRLTLAISASGHSGMEACLANLLEPNETILIVRAGIWGHRALDMASRLQVRAEILATELGEPLNHEELEAAMKKFKPSVVFVVHSESSTGLRQPLIGLGDIVRRYDALLVVDTVASLGAEPFFMDAWKIDAVYSGSQKVLGAPPGITPISFSARAEKKLFARTVKVPVFYWDMKLLGNYWNCFNEPERLYHHTISASLVYGLREGLAQIVEEGLEASWKRHAAAARQLWQGLVSRGLELFVKDPEYRLSTVTTLVLPLGSDSKTITRRMMEKWNIEISGGLGPTVGKVLRIGLMGANATTAHVETVLKALDDVLKSSQLSHL